MLDLNRFHQGDALVLAPKLTPGSINEICTSPPYFQQRDYGLPPTNWPEVSYSPMPGLSHVTIPTMSCCLGRETTIEAYVGHLVLLLRLLRPALRSDGIAWLNIGDKRANDTKKGGDSGNKNYTSVNGGYNKIRADPPKTGLPPKNLCGIPWRLALALQADNWTLRSDVIWHKPNGSPSSVVDRPTDAHEYLFLLANQPRYWYDNEAIKTPVKPASLARLGGGVSEKANRRTVWKMATAQYPGSHFAVMPAAMAELCILSGCPSCVCSECEVPYSRVIEKIGGNNTREPAHVPNMEPTETDSAGWQPTTRPTNQFEPQCSCDAPSHPGIVLDPFSGSGTVAEIAIKHSRHWLGFDLNPEYIHLANKRIDNTAVLLPGIGL